jgi:hypothetical protein
MAISLKDITNAAMDYFSRRVVASISVDPLGKQQQINPDEKFNITLTIQNSEDDPDQGVRIDNLGYRVWVDNVNEAALIVPETDVAVAYSDLLRSSNPLTPKSEQSSMYLFPPAPHDSLYGGGRYSITIQGRAKVVGEPKVTFFPQGAIDFQYLFPTVEVSPGISQPINIVKKVT